MASGFINIEPEAFYYFLISFFPVLQNHNQSVEGNCKNDLPLILSGNKKVWAYLYLL